MKNQVANLIARAIVRLVGDSGGRQTAQLEITKDELMSDVPRLQNYGLTSVPPAAGSDAIVLFLNGDRERGVIIGMENMGLRVKDLGAGDVAIYDNRGNVIKLTEQQVEVTSMLKLVTNSPEIETTAPTKVTTTSPDITLQAGGSSIHLTSAAVDIVSPVLTHNGKNIGATHYHVGSPSTAVPV